jgi:hypothetical protein
MVLLLQLLGTTNSNINSKRNAHAAAFQEAPTVQVVAVVVVPVVLALATAISALPKSNLSPGDG